MLLLRYDLLDDDVELDALVDVDVGSWSVQEVVSFVAEEWAPYLTALVSSCAVMPLSALLRTPCTRMCLRSVSAGCGLGVSD